MVEQATLELPFERPETQAFWAFHESNPQVYRELVDLCRLAREKGRRRWSINGAFEVLRWSRLVTHGDEFKLNNNYRAAYARLIMAKEPDLEGFFQTRRSRADG